MTEDTQNLRPKNKRRLFQWLLFEPVRFNKYNSFLGAKHRMLEFFQSYGTVAFIALFTWLSLLFLASRFDIPLLLTPKLLSQWQQQPNGWERFLFFAQYPLLGIAAGLVSGALLTPWAGLGPGLTLGIAFAFSGGLVSGLVSGLVFGFTLSAAFGASSKRIRILMGFLPIPITSGLMAADLLTFSGTLLTLAGWVLTYFRIFPFFLLHLLGKNRGIPFPQTPYARDGLIWLPVPPLDSYLLEGAKKDPLQALEWSAFLLENRPLQNTIAGKLAHCATASLWIKGDFGPECLALLPPVTDDNPRYRPSDLWFDRLETVKKEQLQAYQKSNRQGKMEEFGRYLEELKGFKEWTLHHESSTWSVFYKEALESWHSQATAELGRLKFVAESHEPIASNRYRPDQALIPAEDGELFTGRGDIVGELRNRVLRADNMPLFLIHGQPLVGKSSLLNFLPHVLGPEIKTIPMDLGELAGIPDWIATIRKEFDKALGITLDPGMESEGRTWSERWEKLLAHISRGAREESAKIILAFDRYEKLHFHFQARPDAAQELLDSMRAFSLAQDRVAFLFVGTAPFAELQDPNWSNYFVQSVRFKLDYFTEAETYHLMDAGGLGYDPEVKGEVFLITQGHPALVQRLCAGLVGTANARRSWKVGMDALEEVLLKEILVPKNGVTDVFWHRFCEAEGVKTAVRRIVDGEGTADPRAAFKLMQHGYLVKGTEGYFLRIPIFEEWVRRFGRV